MKKRYYLLYLIVAVLVTACNHEEINLFDDSSANRADATINKYMDILTDASNGWLMEYYPGTMQEYGGYNILVSFGKDGLAEVASEIANPTDLEISLYSIKQSAGIMLSFDTYNDIFHFFSDPADPAGVGGKGFGFEGDYEFLVLEASAEKVLLKGKKTGGIAILTPIQAGKNWADYISDIQDAEEAMTFLKYNLVMGSAQAIPVSVYFRTLTFTYEENGSSVSVVASYIVTETGYKFYKPVKINGVTLSEFTFDAGNVWFTEVSDVNVKLIPIIPPLNEQFLMGNWSIVYSGLGTSSVTALNSLRTRLGAETLYYLNFGTYTNGMYGIIYGSIRGGTTLYAGVLEFDAQLTDEDKVTFSFTGYGYGGDINTYYSHLNGSGVLGLFNNRTFTLTTDNINNPSYITLTQDGNVNNSFKMYKATVYYPYNN